MYEEYRAVDRWSESFAAQVDKVQTLADQGIRVTLDLQECPEMVMIAAKLIECKRAGEVLRVTIESDRVY